MNFVNAVRIIQTWYAALDGYSDKQYICTVSRKTWTLETIYCAKVFLGSPVSKSDYDLSVERCNLPAIFCLFILSTDEVRILNRRAQGVKEISCLHAKANTNTHSAQFTQINFSLHGSLTAAIISKSAVEETNDKKSYLSVIYQLSIFRLNTWLF